MTLGGILSVRLIVTVCECCSERVASGASLLLSSALPLSPLLICLSSFHPSLFPSLSFSLTHSVNALSCFTLLPYCPSITPHSFNSSSSSDPPPAFPLLSFYHLSSFRFYLPHPATTASWGFWPLRSNQDLWLETGTRVKG